MGTIARRLERSLVEEAEFRPWWASESEESRAGQSYVDLPSSPTNTEANQGTARSRMKTLNALPYEGGARGGYTPAFDACASRT